MRKNTTKTIALLLTAGCLTCATACQGPDSRSTSSQSADSKSAASQSADSQSADSQSASSQSASSQSANSQSASSQSASSQSADSQSASSQSADSQSASSQSADSQSADLTFAELSGYTFEFCSGAGAWQTVLTIEENGDFHGVYHDSDMGDMGDGYENGTVYTSVFSGHFTDLTKVDDTTWKMTLTDLSYRDTVGETRIDETDKIRYIYTEAYGLMNSDTFLVYEKGTPTAALSDKVLGWLAISLESETELTMPAIANPETEEAFYSYEQ